MKDKKKITILYLMEYPIDLPGGGQMSTQTLCEGICAYSAGDLSLYKFDSFDDDYEYVPVVACPNLLSAKKEDYPFEIVTYESDENRELSKYSRIKNFVSRIDSFRRIIKSVKPDLIHVSMSESLISFGFLRVLGMFSEIPFVYTDRGLCYGYRKHSKICIKMTLNRAARMLTTTQFNKNLWLKENLNCDITVIPNTISPAFDYFNPQKREEMRDKYKVGKGEFVIGFAGRISEEKDWDFAPVFVENLAKAGIKIKVALVLSVYEERDADIVASIKDKIIASLGEENLIYMQDLSQKEISDYYYLVDAFIMTSSFESFGKAAVEAMSRKCVVLSTGVGGLKEVIGKSENIYEKDKPLDYITKIKEYMSDESILESDREYFYGRYKDNYTKERNVVSHIGLYKEILKL